MIALEEALGIVLGAVRPLESEPVELAEAAGRILARDIESDLDMPPFDKAAVDGYACRRADLGQELSVVETIPAGSVPTQRIGVRQCAKVMTGAIVPAGADCVVMVEQTEIARPGGIAKAGRGLDDGLPHAREPSSRAEPLAMPPGPSASWESRSRLAPGNDSRPSGPVSLHTVRITGASTGDNICPRGEDVRAGQVVLRQGTRLPPSHIALAAAVGCAQPQVFRRPRVTVLSTGDELVPPGVRPQAAQIRDSNSDQLCAQARQVGAIVCRGGIVADRSEQIETALRKAVAESDLVLLTGGVSAGDYDYVPQIMGQVGLHVLFHKVAVKPGTPTLFAVGPRAACFGLPGNPVSSFVIFELLVKPFLYRMMGHDYRPLCVPLPLAVPVRRGRTERQSWIPVSITSSSTVAPVEYHGPAHIAALSDVDGLIHIDAGVPQIDQGALVAVRLIGG